MSMTRQLGRTTKLTPQQIIALREDYATGLYSQPALGRKYGLGPAQVGKIVRGEAWQHVTRGEPVTTESDAQLRVLSGQVPPPPEGTLERLLKVQEEVNHPTARPANPYTGVKDGGDDDDDPQAWAERVKRMTEEGQRRRSAREEAIARGELVPPKKTEIRALSSTAATAQGTSTLDVHEAKEIGAVNAEELLGELKDEHDVDGCKK